MISTNYYLLATAYIFYLKFIDFFSLIYYSSDSIWINNRCRPPDGFRTCIQRMNTGCGSYFYVVRDIYPVRLSHADRRVGCRSVTRAHIIDWVRSPNFISWFTEYHAYAHHLVKQSLRAVTVLCQDKLWDSFYHIGIMIFCTGVNIHACFLCENV